MSKSLNKIQIIGNLTGDAELKETQSGKVCHFTVATNRQYKTTDGQQKEDAEFHKVVAWARLAEIIADHLKKSDRVYVEGRIHYRKLEDGRVFTEIVAESVIFLSKKGDTDEYDGFS